MKTKRYLIVLIQCFLFILIINIPSFRTEEKDIFAGLKIGDRIAVTLKNDRVFKGEIKVLRSDRVTLDISYDDLTLKGKISFFREDIKNITILMSLTQDEKNKELIRKREQLKKYRRQVEEHRPVLPEVKKKEISLAEPKKTEKEKEEERLLGLLKRFPLEAGWNEKRRTDILEKMLVFQTLEEKEFLKIYDDWKKAVELRAQLNRWNLLEKFPAEEGWGEEKHEELSSRFIRIGTALNAQEKEFVDNFEEWQKALEECKAKEEAENKAKVKQPTSTSHSKESKQ